MSTPGSPKHHYMTTMWAREQHRAGRRDGHNNRPSAFDNEHYQSGYREGQAARERLRVVRETIWLGNGFGSETTHTAFLGEIVVGRWRKVSASNFAFDQRGAAVAFYKDWKAALTRGY